MFYVLEDRQIVPCGNVHRWTEWMQTKENKIVKQETIGAYFLSTVFLGIDHGSGENKPVLFETMIFRDGSAIDEFRYRYHTIEEAEAGHQLAAMLLKQRSLTESESNCS